ncbi:hypothetical protein CDAR_485991 [Caerostris darwini]|uniref:Uncharacterized protein n=1 Tax=Caerostris darwini TaxID=1538125 RepID=A0AAV4WL23_9ARAC|nr:hypothetical protein CDAR_485991 [Caerostris darwini]
MAWRPRVITVEGKRRANRVEPGFFSRERGSPLCANAPDRPKGSNAKEQGQPPLPAPLPPQLGTSDVAYGRPKDHSFMTLRQGRPLYFFSQNTHSLSAETKSFAGRAWIFIFSPSTPAAPIRRSTYFPRQEAHKEHPSRKWVSHSLHFLPFAAATQRGWFSFYLCKKYTASGVFRARGSSEGPHRPKGHLSLTFAHIPGSGHKTVSAPIFDSSRKKRRCRLSTQRKQVVQETFKNIHILRNDILHAHLKSPIAKYECTQYKRIT